MMDAAVILDGLARIANDWHWLAVFWHIYFAALGFALFLSIPCAAYSVLLTMPLFSVSLLSWLDGNPFNATVFAVIGAVLLTASFGLKGSVGTATAVWMKLSGIMMFIFGWSYPHFLQADAFAIYLYAAPTGLIPCPTLSAVIGLALIGDAFGSRIWIGTAAMAGIFYGLFGAVYLGVTLDWILFAGSLLLLTRVPLKPEAGLRDDRVSNDYDV